MNHNESNSRPAEDKSSPDRIEVSSSDDGNSSVAPPANAQNEWWSWLSDASPRIAYGIFFVLSYLVGRWCGVPATKTAFGLMRPAAVGAFVLASPVLVLMGLYWVFDHLYAQDTTTSSAPLPDQWWLLFNGRPAGPFTSAWLADAFKRGDFPMDSLIAPSGSTEWRAVSQWPDWAGAGAPSALPTIIPPST